MSLSPLASERITAVVSTLVAIAILAAGVTAHQSRPPLNELERLESDLQFQLDWAFRHDTKERLNRIAQLEEAIDAWHSSPRSEADHDLLAAWLLESTVRSMPGTTKPLPEVPEFGKQELVVAEEPVETKQEEKLSIEKTPIKTNTESAERPPALSEPTKADSPITNSIARNVLVPEPESNYLNAADSTDNQVFEIHDAPAVRETPTGAHSGEAKVVIESIASAIEEAQPAATSSSLPAEELFKEPTAEIVEAVLPQEKVVSKVNLLASAEAAIQINLTELAARIAGYHEQLDQVETTLLLKSSPDLKFLESQVKKLSDLVRDYRFVELYYDALSKREKRHMSTPRWMGATLLEIENLIQDYENEQDQDFLGSFDPAHVQRIEKLRQQLAALAQHKKG